MLVDEENEILSHVGPGTRKGNLLRRSWTPACLSVELEAGSPLEVRLLGDVRTIRSAGKVLAQEEDWRLLGTDDDPAVQEAMRSQRVEQSAVGR